MHPADQPDPFDDQLDSYLDETMSVDDRAAFEKTLESDEERRREIESLRSALRLVRELPNEAPPSRFLWAVQHRIRRRTRGRYFAYWKEPSMVLEAAVCAVLIFLTAALYLVGAAPKPVAAPGDTSAAVSSRVTLAPADRRFVENWGTIDLVVTSIVGSDLDIQLEVAALRFDDFRRAVASHPRMTLQEPTIFRRGAAVSVTVRALAGPMVSASP
jgi:anti-sigma factor RsiW